MNQITITLASVTCVLLLVARTSTAEPNDALNCHINRSTNIVVAEVVRFLGSEGLIKAEHVVEFKAVKALSGEFLPDQKLVVVIYGYGDDPVTSMPFFSTGNRCILFLNAAPFDVWYTLDNWHGVYPHSKFREEAIVQALKKRSDANLRLAPTTISDDPSAFRWFYDLTSTNYELRISAAKEIISARNKAIESLIEIAQSPIMPGESIYYLDNYRNVAIILLGRLKANEAMETLISSLIPDRLRDGTRDNLTVVEPGVIAMIEIGYPALQYLESRSLTETNAVIKKTIRNAILEVRRGLEKRAQ
ncbi:MAG TPA: hypothetical protein PKE26_01625 [Kiritimatiellia bacterium]|nr:hypothetical protein [Kiritimatiellia bacterium]HMO97789.1 hypothetical protein [Kiritimatiellia bacterium]HMP96381.1 hypothetical protein [Kiritimatiellia bacterium]